MNSFIFFTHPDSSADESSLSTRREARLNDKVGQGEEGGVNLMKIKLMV